MRAQPESREQAAIVNLLTTVVAPSYILGTRRRQHCHACGAVSTDQGTRQSPGLGDIFTFLPLPPLKPQGRSMAVWIEVKAAGGRLSPEQRTFQELCGSSHMPYLTGGLDAVIAFLKDGGWVKDDRADRRQARASGSPTGGDQ